MPEVTGRVDKLKDKKASNGGEYTAITLVDENEKKTFFDWDGQCAAAGVAVGDTVNIEHDGSDFPRIAGLHKLKAVEAVERERVCGQQDRDSQIAKMCALKCAAAVLQGSELTYKTRVGRPTLACTPCRPACAVRLERYHFSGPEPPREPPRNL